MGYVAARVGMVGMVATSAARAEASREAALTAAMVVRAVLRAALGRLEEEVREPV